MAYQKKTAKEKLNDSKGLPKVERIAPKQEKLQGKGTIVIPAPIEVDEIMKIVPKGKLITINQIRQKLAKKHRTTIACPITTGIFARIAADAAEEDAAEGKKNITPITPYWRTLKEGGEINPKYPGGVENQKKLLEKEGHKVIQKRKRYFVDNFEKNMVKI